MAPVKRSRITGEKKGGVPVAIGISFSKRADWSFFATMNPRPVFGMY